MEHGLVPFEYNAEGQQLVPDRNAKIDASGFLNRERWVTIREHVGSIYSFFDEHFGHELFAKERSTVAVTMNYGDKYMNAHWTGKRVILGSGDDAFLDDFHKAADVIAHEIFHGIILRTSGLGNSGEPGALSEHLADVFGLLYKHYTVHPNGIADACFWTIGEGLWSPPGGFFEKYVSNLDLTLTRKFWLAAGGKIVDNHSRHDPEKSTNSAPEQAHTFKKLPKYL
ncbi:subtilisin-like protein [Fusarium equiseti]|uniref:Subtilisin-like protein n=1 Tax=Fusarium equiseti TaxID=61235 RepID=A0ABQ8QXR3_FUSEQ|nr:subtilisin-like protein [Fusarium equiseti]